MYKTKQVQIHKDDPLYEYCSDVTQKVNNLENAALFRMKQCMSGLKKKTPTANEQFVLDEIRNALPYMKNADMPTAEKWFLSYTFLDSLMKATGNPDYCVEGLSKQTAQNALKQVVKNMKSFVKAVKAYSKNPAVFTGRPRPPKYHKKGGMATATLSNQDCNVRDGYVKFPLTKTKVRIGETNGTLKTVKIVPYHDIFILAFTFDIGDAPKKKKKGKRIIAIDEGVENFAAITNNIGKPSLLYKGGAIKSANWKYNKVLASEMSKQMTGTAVKFSPTDISRDACIRRNNFIHDACHKIAKDIMNKCIAWDIDTIVIGRNKGVKQECNMGHVNNQVFVQIPFYKFNMMIEYLAEENGINVVYQEESYTSKASCPDGDAIPVYGDHSKTHVFSGTRIARGLYRTSDGTVINADLNGSANIMRKAFPKAFKKQMPLFHDVEILRYPDVAAKHNNKSKKPMSKSKKCRLYKKYSLWDMAS